jgi:protein subunit release factor A
LDQSLQTAIEWCELFLHDAEAQAMAELALQTLHDQLVTLETLAPLSGPEDHLDCFVEVSCNQNEGLYYKLRPIARFAEQQGYAITALLDQDRSAVWEVAGHFAYGRMRQFAGQFTCPLSEIGGATTTDRIEYQIKIFPIPKFQEHFGLRDADLKLDVFRAQRYCCAGNHGGGIRMLHKPTGLSAEVISHQGQAWCEAKAKQLLQCKLQAQHPKS